MKETAGRVRFTLTSDLEELARMRSWLWTALVGQDLPVGDCSALVLAVGELCNNAIKHAYHGTRGQPIHVSLDARPDRVVIEVEDFGEPFDAARYRAPDLDATPEHGLGLYLVKCIADHVAFDVARDAGTRWTLVKYRPGHAPAGGDSTGDVAGTTREGC